MRPLARVWKALEDVKNDPNLTLSLEEVTTIMDNTVLLLEQAFQAAFTTIDSMLSPQSRKIIEN